MLINKGRNFALFDLHIGTIVYFINSDISDKMHSHAQKSETKLDEENSLCHLWRVSTARWLSSIRLQQRAFHE